MIRATQVDHGQAHSPGSGRVHRPRTWLRRQHRRAGWRVDGRGIVRRRRRGGWRSHTSRQYDEGNQPRSVRDRGEVLPEHRRGDGFETHGAPDAHAARPHDEGAPPHAREDGGGERAAARSRSRPTTSTPRTSRSRRRTSRPTRSGSMASPPAFAPHRPASSTAPPAAIRPPASRPRPRSSWAAPSGERWRTRSSRATPILLTTSVTAVGLPDADRRSGRRHA